MDKHYIDVFRRCPRGRVMLPVRTPGGIMVPVATLASVRCTSMSRLRPANLWAQLPTVSPKERGVDAPTGRGAGPHKRHAPADGHGAVGPVAPRPHAA